MNKDLVIVESSAKAKTINKYLGNNYVVKSSIGHVRDLPTSSLANKRKIKSTLSENDRRSVFVNRMGVDPWHDWQAKYEVLPGKEKIVNELKQLAEKADRVYLATDLDREGEAIAWHLREVIGGDNKRYSRIVFNEITKNVILQAFEKPVEINIDRVNAQQARRFMDRVVGYMISPLLWKKIARGLSAGRVQSIAMRLIVEREREIKVFVSKEFWKINVDVATLTGEALLLQVTHQNDEPFRPKNNKQTMTATALLEKAHYQVLECEYKLTRNKPNAPFITSTLQQAASTILGFNIGKTMMIAQRLYETGYITYIRTDSTNLSNDAINIVRDYISKNFGNKYLPKNAVRYDNKQNSQEAHEAIRPSNIFIQSNTLKDVEIDAQMVYQLIWCQFVACQMTEVQYNSTTLTIGADNFRLKAYSRIMCFDGWKRVMSMMLRKDDGDQILPVVKKGDELLLIKLTPEQYFTKPPARFSEASLIKELEKRGIGRPSTYVSIISTIQNRGYVSIENRRFYAEKIGEIVTSRLEKSFYKLMNYNFTAQMEDYLDKIANCQAEWKNVLNGFFSDFISQLDKAEKDPEKGGMQPNQMVIIDINCPTCGHKMGIRTAITGVFLSCSSYAMSLKTRCKTTINLIPDNKIIKTLERNSTEVNTQYIKHHCKKCNTVMDGYLIDSEHKLYICGNNPVCDGYESEKGEFYIKNYNNQIINCDKCSSEMHQKIGRFGKYMACTNNKCKNTRKILRSGEVALPKENPVPLPELKCEKSDAYFTLRDSATGIFLAANTFPKSRETRAPLVEELYRFRDRLPAKLHYLADAPQYDAKGNKTVIRFNRRTKQQYVVAEKEGKTTSWSAFFINNKWIEN